MQGELSWWNVLFSATLLDQPLGQFALSRIATIQPDDVLLTSIEYLVYF